MLRRLACCALFTATSSRGLIAQAAISQAARSGASHESSQRAMHAGAHIAGTYTHRFRNSDIDGDVFESVNSLEISVLDQTRIHYVVNLEFFNGHDCFIQGDATWQSSGIFEDRTQESATNANGIAELACVFQIRPMKTGVSLADPTGACRKMSCGSRGTYDETKFLSRERISPVHPPAPGAATVKDK